MYWWLQSRLPTWAAQLVTAAWYVLLVLAIVYCAFEPAAEFKYTRI